MNKIQSVPEDQLWLWLDGCEARKPTPRQSDELPGEDQVVWVLQYGVREGGDGDEVVVGG